MSSKTIRDFSKRGDALPVPVLTRVQSDAYRRFLQLDKNHDERDPNLGLEALMREVFPIESYDGSMKLEYIHYKLDEPRYTADECRELRLTYGRPFRVGVRFGVDISFDRPRAEGADVPAFRRQEDDRHAARGR